MFGKPIDHFTGFIKNFDWLWRSYLADKLNRLPNCFLFGEGPFVIAASDADKPRFVAREKPNPGSSFRRHAITNRARLEHGLRFEVPAGKNADTVAERSEKKLNIAILPAARI
jgi:hypothetical protein